MKESAPPTTVIAERPEPNLVIRVLWFLFVGWWLSGLATLVAILFQLTIIGIPLAVWVVNRIPQTVTLKSSHRLYVSENVHGVTVVRYADRQQRPWWVRTIYYLLVG